jgi:hypothetical protein
MINLPYAANDALLQRFCNHVAFAVMPTIEGYKDSDKNIIEKAGDLGLWAVEKLPNKLWKTIKDPKIVTLSLTIFALLADSFVFYPSKTTQVLKTGFALLPTIPFWSVRLSLYILSVQTILATFLRAEGRFLNEELKNRFYAQINPRLANQG